ncbi:Recombination-associated protein RdgC [Sterolibacterium denitrificans]|uniref:Recombination-associated protein RdgC n=2 Tax=Sterolibacterium denitrificans TaxID=157592 RepID=A0A7Z7MWG8_9PROT|nr:recombination-associated protein RdgC [Sterolibacterium denitrificans]KYC29290.1 recombinase RdgC [Sterolibacterium denitrificans]SMB30496.1 Recombination-associated protein RdgC [Sterolibacterium denitrificans]
MWFRNLQIYRLDPDWQTNAAGLQLKLEKHAFRGCSASEMQARGWVPPRGNPDELVIAANRQLLICLGVEQKLLPASVVRQYAQERLAELEEQQGFKPGRRQTLDVREAVTAELLPRAFVKRRLTYVWFELQGGWCAIDAGSAARAEEVVEHLKQTLGELPLRPLRTQLSPAAAMSAWLAASEAPDGFTIDRDCELRAVGEDRATVRYVRHTLEAAEIAGHIAAGKSVTRLALTWQDRIAFVLTEQLQVKRLAFLDLLKEEAERQAESADELFEADFLIMSGEFSRLLPQLVAALGGEGGPDEEGPGSQG